MLQRLIIALNSINTPLLAIIVVIIGCIYSVVCKEYGMNAESAAGIIGAGIGLLTGQALSKARADTADVQSSAGTINGETIAKVLVLCFVLTTLMSGCTTKSKAVPVAALAPQVSQMQIDSATPNLTDILLAAQCPIGMTSVAAVTALDPNFQSASVQVVYVATNDGQGTAIPCVAAMSARENTASNSTIPQPKD